MYYYNEKRIEEWRAWASNPSSPKSTTESAMNVNTGADKMPKMYNLIVSDVGKKSVSIGTLWYDESRKAQISGFISKDDLSAALKNKTVTCQPGSEQSRFFAGKPCFRIAAFPVTRRGTQSQPSETKEEEGL